MFKKRDLFIVGGIALVALALLLALPALRPQAGTDEPYYVHITVNNVDWGVVELSEITHESGAMQGTGEIIIEQETGEKNVLRVTDTSVVMQESTCHNQLCVNQQGEVTAANRNERPLQNMIICLPNRVTVELLTGSEAAAYEPFGSEGKGNEQ